MGQATVIEQLLIAAKERRLVRYLAHPSREDKKIPGAFFLPGCFCATQIVYNET